MKRNFLGIRIFEPRANQYDQKLFSLTLEMVLTREGYLDRSTSSSDSVTVEFMRWDVETDFRGATFNLRTSDAEVMALVATFIRKYEKWRSENLLADTIHTFIVFCTLNKIPQVFYSDGLYFRSPNEKCFNWFENGCSQGKLFAISQHQALKRISKTGANLNNVRVEEVANVNYNEYYWFKPEWVWTGFDFKTPASDNTPLWTKIESYLDRQYNLHKQR